MMCLSTGWYLPCFVPQSAIVTFIVAAVFVISLESIPGPVEVSVAELGEGLLGPYTLAFELISVVLLVAMAGAVLIAFQGKGKSVR